MDNFHRRYKMGKAFRITLVVVGVLVIASGLVFAGIWIDRRNYFVMNGPQSAYQYPLAPGRRAGGYQDQVPGSGNGWGMMNRRGNGPGMMGGGTSSGGFGPGMMYGYQSANPSAAPLTVDQAYQAASAYLAALNNPDLKIAEVMVFSNNAYVRVIEQGTGIGAFELLVNPSTLAVTPEPGPNMMWNLKYGGMNQAGMMGGRNGMMGNYSSGATPSAVTGTMPVSSAQALQAAQQYLDTALPGTKTAADADPFYGYYTIDITRDGSIIGMLSVNGYDSQVFMHTWHGTFISTQDY
jgi:hypothetical protein